MVVKVHDELEQLLQVDPEQAINMIYKEYYQQLYLVVLKIVKQRCVAEDVMQDIMMEIWKKRERIVLNTSIYGYLKRSCVNRSLNHLRQNKMQFEHDNVLEQESAPDLTDHFVEVNDLNEIIAATILVMPERCRLTFILSRYKHLSYKEISRELKVSTKTVEHQISKALKMLKAEIAPYLAADY